MYKVFHMLLKATLLTQNPKLPNQKYFTFKRRGKKLNRFDQVSAICAFCNIVLLYIYLIKESDRDKYVLENFFLLHLNNFLNPT